MYRLLFRWKYVDTIFFVLFLFRSFSVISHKRNVGFRSGLISTHLQFSWTHRRSIAHIYVAQLIWIYGTSLKDEMNVNLL